MNVQRLIQFRRVFSSHHWGKRERRLYARQWCRCIRLLGDKWLLAEQVSK